MTCNKNVSVFLIIATVIVVVLTACGGRQPQPSLPDGGNVGDGGHLYPVAIVYEDWGSATATPLGWSLTDQGFQPQPWGRYFEPSGFSDTPVSVHPAYATEARGLAILTSEPTRDIDWPNMSLIVRYRRAFSEATDRERATPTGVSVVLKWFKADCLTLVDAKEYATPPRAHSDAAVEMALSVGAPVGAECAVVQLKVESLPRRVYIGPLHFLAHE